MQVILDQFKCILANKSLIFSIYYYTHIGKLYILFFPHMLVFHKIPNEKYIFKIIYSNKHANTEKTL